MSRIVAQKFRDFLIVTDGDDLDKEFTAVSRASSVIRVGATGNVVMTGLAEYPAWLRDRFNRRVRSSLAKLPQRDRESQMQLLLAMRAVTINSIGGIESLNE